MQSVVWDDDSCGTACTAHRTMNPASVWHQPVLLEPTVQFLNPRPGGLIVDGTVGSGGHSAALLPRLLPDGRLIAIDRDPTALALAEQRLSEFAPMITFLRGDFRDLRQHLARIGRSGVDGLLVDLGMSSLQVDAPERGFSFLKEGPLDMRMDPDQQTTAETLVHRLSADELTTLFGTLGEERFSRRIAHRIVQERRTHPITTTTQLARLVTSAVPPGARHGRLHPATRVFQALRMAVNDELGALDALLADLHELLNPGGRAAIISFHSLEDRRVKHAFVQGMRDELWTVLTKKPVGPTDDEMDRNPRARSAKLRAVERLA